MAKSQQRDDVVGTMPRTTFTLCMRSVSRASGGTEYQPGMELHAKYTLFAED
jgi:hypothetical protein